MRKIKKKEGKRMKREKRDMNQKFELSDKLGVVPEKEFFSALENSPE